MMINCLKNIVRTLSVLLLIFNVATATARTFDVKGVVVNETTRQPIPFATVVVDGQPQKGTMSNETGEFEIKAVEPGIIRFIGQSIGFDASLSPEIQVSAKTPTVELRLTPNATQIDSIIVRPSLFRRLVDSPVSIRRIGTQQIEKSPGANRDVSRIVQSYPGVAFSPAGYRNDLIVRGGSPSENRFYVDGIEIPNINHFSTEGASGGPVSILNADLIREIEFYTGAFPVQRSGAMSSVMDVKLRDGDLENQSFKFTLGASEASLSGSGHFSDKTTYLFSVRQSYLQMLFKMIGLPFLPNFIDGQVKIKHKFSERDELTALALVGIDKMELNDEGTTETSEYILSYLPKIEQETFTTGLRYRHFSGDNSYSLVLSHSYLSNHNLKYQDNDESNPEKLNLKLRSTDQKTTLRNENRSYLNDNLSLRYGAEVNYIQYDIDSFKALSTGDNTYNSSLNYAAWGAHIGAGYKSDDERFTASLGGRFDGNSFSNQTVRFWEQFSPRASASYALTKSLSAGGSVGVYYAMPPLTALSYQLNGEAVNHDLGYMGVQHYTLGLEWRPQKELFASVEGFYKGYNDLPVSTSKDIPLADLGVDYGAVGNEKLSQDGRGRAYGVELLGEWQVPGKVALVASLTLYRSEYATSATAAYRPSAWDSRVIFNASGTYFLRKGWSVGGKVSAIGGAPYTPYDIDASSQIINWDISGQPLYDYSLYNTLRLGGYGQLDLRVDKTFYFSKWMLGLYLDIQNVLVSEYKQQRIPISTGEIDPADSNRYVMKYLNNVSGTMLPTLGITAQF